MQGIDYLSAIQRESRDLAAAARLGLDVPVAACPGWNVRTLLIHVGNIHRFIADVVEKRARDWETEVDPIHDRHLEERAERQEDPNYADPEYLADWFEEGAENLVRILGAAEPDEPTWTWFEPQQRAGFWRRRMAQELAVHRWDAQEAHGVAKPIEPELARDGVDEALDVHLPERMVEAGTRGEGESYHFHRTDGEGEWFVRFDPAGAVVSHEHSKGDMAVRGTASNLLLFLWQRHIADGLEVVGDVTRLARWWELVPPE